MTRCRLFAQWRWGSWERKDNVNVTFGGFRSSRMGIELEFTWNLSPRLGASPNLRSFPRPRAPITEQALLHPGGRPQLCVCIFFFFFFFLFWPPPGHMKVLQEGSYESEAQLWLMPQLQHAGSFTHCTTLGTPGVRIFSVVVLAVLAQLLHLRGHWWVWKKSLWLDWGQKDDVFGHALSSLSRQ